MREGAKRLIPAVHNGTVKVSGDEIERRGKRTVIGWKKAGFVCYWTKAVGKQGLKCQCGD